mmetsp:Transcript_14477/g.48496  ORF Transcript_14477/g.48496 Transcript_14477/m.48496 type:complete len:462 (+) Transcript_14477:1012-2397(+)
MTRQSFEQESPSCRTTQRLPELPFDLSLLGYRDMAWGEDSVLPIAGRGTHSGFGCAVTMVDSLDTLWLVGLHAEFKEAVDYISQKSFGEKLSKISAGASVFESTIRILGGLLGAYELSKEPVLLERARQIGERVVSALRADGSCPATFGGGGGGCASLAHGGTTQLELAYLAHHLGEARLSDKSLRFYDAVRARPALDGLWPQCFGARSGRITLGAESDSFYEYLIKVWLLTDKKDDALWRMYDAAVDGMEKHMLSRGADGLLYLDNLDWHGGNSAGKDVAMEHLSCFVPGWLALGAVHQTDPERKARHLAIADEIATTCFAMYDKQPTKIGPERVKRHKMDLSATDTRECILRPEAVEGWWYMAETVPELAHKYRDWGWRSFQAMDSQLRVAHGHASMRDVSRPPGSGNANLLDRMESFWMAETLKYFYLLQDESHPLPLDEFIMNTEAHPMRVLRPKAA